MFEVNKGCYAGMLVYPVQESRTLNAYMYVVGYSRIDYMVVVDKNYSHMLMTINGSIPRSCSLGEIRRFRVGEVLCIASTWSASL